jgi:hypothetical protein
MTQGPHYEPFGWHHWPEHFFMSYQFRRALTVYEYAKSNSGSGS